MLRIVRGAPLAGLVLLGLSAVPLAAQGPGGGGGWGMPGGHGGHHGGWGGGHGGQGGSTQHAVPDPVIIEGPPKPDDFAAMFQLADSQRARYDSLYHSLMDSTADDRDSVAAARQEIREAFQSGDREGAEQPMHTLRTLTKDLENRQKKFDDSLKHLLTHDQWKDYDKWRGERRKEAEEEMRGRYGRGGNTGEP